MEVVDTSPEKTKTPQHRITFFFVASREKSKRVAEAAHSATVIRKASILGKGASVYVQVSC